MMRSLPYFSKHRAPPPDTGFHNSYRRRSSPGSAAPVGLPIGGRGNLGLTPRRLFIARPSVSGPPQKDGPRVNDEIDSRTVRLVDAEGNMVGVVPRLDALRAAEDAGLDLVEVSPNADPPVCKILDFGRFKYEIQKKKNEARKRQKIIEVKEVKLRPGIDQHDYDIKMRSMNRFLDEGDKVKVTLRFRGREMVHQELGMKVLERVREELAEKAKVEQFPKMEGRQLIMVIAPR